MKDYTTYAPHKYFSIIKKGCYREATAYKKIYGGLLYYVDNYFYERNSKEMKYMLGSNITGRIKKEHRDAINK